MPLEGLAKEFVFPSLSSRESRLPLRKAATLLPLASLPGAALTYRIRRLHLQSSGYTCSREMLRRDKHRECYLTFLRMAHALLRLNSKALENFEVAVVFLCLMLRFELRRARLTAFSNPHVCVWVSGWYVRCHDI